MARTTTIKGTFKSDALQGSELRSDIIFGYGGDDWLFGYGGDDILNGGDGDDHLIAGSGDDTLEGGAGADYLSGGRGIDTASYAGSKSGVTVDLDANAGTRGDAEGDTYVSIENITGSSYDDILVGNKAWNVIRGGAGDDLIDGGHGNDTLYGGDDNDEIHGGNGDDVLNGGDGGDDLFGGANNDTFIGGNGIDHHDGGSGEDTVDYSNGTQSAIVGLGEGIGDTGLGLDGFGSYDTFVSIENIIGTEFSDEIYGNDADNTFYAGDGNDGLDGGGGDDELHGEAGDDYFLASAGSDVYYGGDDIDTIDYFNFDHGVHVDLTENTVLGEIGDDVDTIYGVENVVGTSHSDILRGDDSDNILSGKTGADWYADSYGNDIYRSSSDGDTDTFYFGDTNIFDDDENQGEEIDVIENFEVGIDKIDFTYASGFTGFNDLFNGGDRFAEEVNGDTIIHYYDHQIVLEDVRIGDLNASDFIFA